MKWLRTLFSGKPHFYIGGQDHPYMLRWFLIPRNKFFNVYLHKFMRDDDDRALHDHPWWFVSLIVKGGYIEVLNGENWIKDAVVRTVASIAYRPAVHRHRVVLFRYPNGQPRPCWTLVITGPKSRTWGFWCPKGFVPWHKFVDENDHGNIGRGCGETL